LSTVKAGKIFSYRPNCLFSQGDKKISASPMRRQALAYGASPCGPPHGLIEGDGGWFNLSTSGPVKR
jgi:hypothetical protein